MSTKSQSLDQSEISDSLPAPEYLSLERAKQYLDCSTTTLHDLKVRGKIKHYYLEGILKPYLKLSEINALWTTTPPYTPAPTERKRGRKPGSTAKIIKARNVSHG